jgi:2-polyprenyl-3-methyl-5-hydroxy-6-metoxy-1,4-benzoquinol methylase
VKIPRDIRNKSEAVFREAARILPPAEVEAALDAGLSRWEAPTAEEAQRRADVIAAEFPDQFAPEAYWNTAASHKFRDFFSWGHDQNFGFGITRGGAMGPRHREIIGECLAYGFFPKDLSGQDVLDVGCWSGGDVLALSGLGATVTAIEEHKRSAESAQRLCGLVGCPANFVVGSVYQDRKDWVRRYDLIYASGVVYHVTDPLLFIRILFAYLKPGGRLILETKASEAYDSSCGYSGILEFGWNWYAPSRAALGRWLVDAGFDPGEVVLRVRENGRLLSCARKTERKALPETAGFSRPGSWLEEEV